MSRARALKMAVALHEQAMDDADKADALVQAYRMLQVSLGVASHERADGYARKTEMDVALEGQRRTLNTRRPKD